MNRKLLLAALALAMSWLMTSCENKTGAIANESSITTNTSSAASTIGNCDKFERALNGDFANSFQVGTMSWSGGTNGQVEISGVDYNDITCTYTIPDCNDEVINMICNQAAYNTTIIVLSEDSIKLGTTTYTRVK